jgi:hypothetical protein
MLLYALTGTFGLSVPLVGYRMLTLAGFALVGVPLATAFVWNRLPTRLWIRVSACATMLVAAQLSAVLFAAVVLNNWGLFYTSWDQLFGSQSGRLHVSAYGSGRSGLPALRVIDLTDQSRATDATQGVVESVTVNGYRSGLAEPALVYLPPQYFQRRYADVRFPGVVAVAGYPGSQESMATRMGYPRVEQALLSEEEIQPMVLVMVRSIVVADRDTECTDVPAGPQALTFFTQDIPAAIDKAFHTAPDRWGAIGVSTGGYCAVKFAMFQSSTFRAAVSLSGYYRARSDNTTGNLWDGSRPLRDLNDLEWRLAHQPIPPVSLLLTMGTQELGPYGLPDTERFVHLVHRPMTVETVFEAGGRHTFSSWTMMLPRAFRFLSARLWSPSLAG